LSPPTLWGVFSRDDGRPRLGAKAGDRILDVGALARAEGHAAAEALSAPVLNPFLKLGADAWSDVGAWIGDRLADPDRMAAMEADLTPVAEATLRLPFEVADYVDFYASREHATNLGRLFRPDAEPLLPNWRYLPVGYHGRSATVVVSGTPVRRPWGQIRPDASAPPIHAPSRRLDLEVELGFVVGAGNALGQPIAVDDFRRHVFGVVLVNDWSARDIQAWEYQPLGPFLGKSFATSISPWVVPLEALDAAWVAPPPRDPQPLPYLRGALDLGLDVRFELEIAGTVVSRPPAAELYWSGAQMLAHLTANGARVRPGDLFASGTVSGRRRDQLGSLIELTRNGAEPFLLDDSTRRRFLEDGDRVVIRATAPGAGGSVLDLGAVEGTILPALER